MDNLTTYNHARFVPEEAKKSITAGRLKGMTDINPMWRIKRLTELFGACGVGWWYEITDKRIVEDDLTAQKAAFVDILLYYVDPVNGHASHGIPGTGGASFVAQERNGPYMSDECFKMALTDAISVAAKALGVGADVYWDKDKSKYDKAEEPKKEPIRCQVCGEVIRHYVGKNGKNITPEAHVSASMQQFGRVLCLGCISAHKEQGEGK